MAYAFQNLPQTVDRRGQLYESKKWSAPARKTSIRNMERAIHHSATRKHLAGSSPEGFSNFHVNTLDWPCIGYAIVITPNDVVDTPKGKRAKIHFCVDLDLVTYHVGNSNDVALGINVAGDYRYDTLDAPTMASYYELMEALDADQIAMGGSFPHSAYPGYEWKKCCVFEPSYAYENGKKHAGEIKVTPNKVEPTPETYVIQQGDTLYQLANNEDFTAEDLASWNGIADPTQLKVGQEIRLSGTAGAAEQKATPYVVGEWKENEYGTQYIEAHGTYTVVGEPVMSRFNSPFDIPANEGGYAKDGWSCDYEEMVRVTWDYDAGIGFIMFGYWVDSKWKYIPYRTWNPQTGEVGDEWGTIS